MMLVQAIKRHYYGFQDIDPINDLYDKDNGEIYRKILRLILDNETSKAGAFSIQNIAKIGYCHEKYPGEWYGPHAISLMLKDLNKIYQPVENFQICMFHDGNIYYDKIKRMAIMDGKAFQLKNFMKTHHSEHKQKVRANIEFMFKDFLNKIGYFHEHLLTRTKHHDLKKSFDSPKKNMEERKSDIDYKAELDEIIDDPIQLKE